MWERNKIQYLVLILILLIKLESLAQNTINFGSEAIASAYSVTHMDILKLSESLTIMAYNANNSGKVIAADISNNTITYGAEQTFNSGSSVQISLCKLSSSGFIIAFADNANSSNGYCIYCTVSGTTITINSSYRFVTENVSSGISISALSSTTFGISYIGTSSHVHAKLGTLSGTSISYGAEATVYSSFGGQVKLAALDNTNLICAYTDGNDYGNLRVLYVSGTSLLLGTNNVFRSSATNYYDIKPISSTSFLLTYRKNSPFYGDVVIGTINASTKTNSIGTPVTFSSVAVSGNAIALLSPNTFIINYVSLDPATSLYTGKSMYGSISGSTITMDSNIYIFNGSSTGISEISRIRTSDLSSAKYIVLYSDNGNSGKATSVIGYIPTLGKKINGATYSKWNNTIIAKWNNQ